MAGLNGIEGGSLTIATNEGGKSPSAPSNAEEFSQILLGTADGDKLEGGDGNDFLNGGEGIDVLKGGTGDDTIIADNQADEVRGGDGDDTIYASNDLSLEDFQESELINKDNRLFGGEPVPVGELKGGSGDDSYVLGSGTHVIDDTAGSDTIKFENGNLSDFDFIRSGDDLLIRGEETSVILKDQFAGNNGVENIEFADGSRLELGDLLKEETPSPSPDGFGGSGE